MKQIDSSARVDRLVSPELPFSHAGFAANDNEPSGVLSGKDKDSGFHSILSQIDCIEPRQSIPMGLVLIVVLCLIAVTPLLLLAF